MDNKKEAMQLHKELRGKLETKARTKTDSAQALAPAHTPGVAQACLAIQEDPNQAYALTRKWNLVVVVSDGIAALGLGGIGGLTGIPVMESKFILFKNFANVDAFPICLATKDIEGIIQTIENIEPSFGGINLEDVKTPKCFEIEQRLGQGLDILVFHDDQHSTAIVVLAVMISFLKLVGKKLEDVRIVMSGARAADMAILHLLSLEGARDVIFVGRKGILDADCYDDPYRKKFLAQCNPHRVRGGMEEALTGADIFIGVSGPGLIAKETMEKMNKDATVFAMANFVPEIYPDQAKAGETRVCGAGRSDFPNQVNNVSVFPDLFRGTLDVRARKITDNMKLVAAHATADSVQDPNEDYILPNVFDLAVVDQMSRAVADQAIKDGVARK